MKIIAKALFDTSQNKFVYALKAVTISLIPAILLSFVIFTLFPNLEEPEFPVGFWIGLISIVLISPLLETLLMWPLIAVLKKFLSSTWKIAIISALCWSILHSLSAPIWGVTIFWSFVVFSISFVEWRKVSKTDAVLVTFLIHMMQNLFAFTMMQLG